MCSQRILCVIGCSVLIVAVFLRGGHAQDSSPEIGACNEVGVDHLHRLQVKRRPDTVDVLERERFRGLLSEAARAGLDLTGEQVESLKRLERRLAAIDRRWEELQWIALRGEPDERRAAAVKEISDEREALQRDINDVLLPAQQSRLVQLQARKAILESGIEDALVGDLTVRLNLDESSLESVRGKLGELRTYLDTTRNEQQEILVTEIVRLLSRKQREALAAHVGDVQRYLAPSFELMVWQSRQERVKDVERKSSIEELLESPEWFRMDLSGALYAADHKGRDRFPPFSRLCYERAYGDLEIVKPQIMDTASPSAESLRQEALLRGKLEEWKQQVLAGQLPIEKFTELAQSGTKDLSRWRVEELVGAFLAHQRTELDRVVLRRSIGVRGLHSCLVDGTLGNVLELTGNQKKQIADLASTRAGELEKTARMLETKIWDELEKAMGDESAAKLNELIGPMSSNLAGCPDLLLRRPFDQ
jgi:hypothetical protein